ncbi:MAG: acyltransferase, partial [Henriciella sp.]|nr:acyltransferase [Henriciella sp.]
MKLTHRSEIDGLRAIAVIPVILFHAGFDLFSGGYVGVDVFFVISGYLISSILLEEMENQKFSLLNFYERRARRLLPALFLVLAVAALAGWILLFGQQRRDFFQSLAAVPLFSSNFLFWRESGYFATEAELKPLLHTWSLAIEEQFYVIFPLLLFGLITWFRKYLVLTIVAIALISLAFAQFTVASGPSTAFFLLHTRFWELLIGALVAIYLRAQDDQPTHQWLSTIGFGLIAFATFVFDANTPFPSLYALVPTLGTALIIVYAGRQTAVHWLLSQRIFVGIGLISYSAYLWHQIVFAYARHSTLEEPSAALFLVLSALSLALAFLSWKYVEQPFRNKSLFDRRAIFAGAAAGSFLFIGIGIYAVQFAKQTDPQQLATVYAEQWPDDDACGFHNGFAEDMATACVTPPSDGKLAFLLGDSHAQALSKTLRAELVDRDYQLVTVSYDGCLPIPLTTRKPLAGWKGCRDSTDAAWRLVEEYPNAPIIISARWAHYLEGTTFDNELGGRDPEIDGRTYIYTPEKHAITKQSLTEHIHSELNRRAQNRKVNHLGPNQQF